MTELPPNMGEPRTWLREIVRPALDDFIAAPLDMRRAYIALVIVNHFHERLFHYIAAVRPALLGSATLADFRREFASASLDLVTEAANSKAGHVLSTSNIVSSGSFTRMFSDADKVQRAIIVARANRQLIPLLEDVTIA